MHDPKPSPRPPDVPQLAKPPPPAAAPTGVPTRANQEPAGAIASSEAEGGERTSKEGRTGGNTRGTAVAAPATPAASTRNPTTATTPATAAPRPPVSEQQAQEEVGHQGGVEEEGEGDAPAPPPQGAPLEEKLAYIKRYKLAAPRPVPAALQVQSSGGVGGTSTGGGGDAVGASRSGSVEQQLQGLSISGGGEGGGRPVTAGSSTTTSSQPRWVQPSGPRRPGEGVENEEQGIISAEMSPTGAVTLRITLLAAGFIIGPSGASVRDIMRHSGADIKSWTDSGKGKERETRERGAGASEAAGPRRPCRVFVIEGEEACVAHALDIIAAAVDRYKELCEGRCQGQAVPRQQRIMGVEFSYQPPPRNVVPYAAALKSHVTRPAPSTGAGSGGASEYDLAAAQLYMNQAALGIGLGLLPPGVMPFIPAPGGSGFVLAPGFMPLGLGGPSGGGGGGGGSSGAAGGGGGAGLHEGPGGGDGSGGTTLYGTPLARASGGAPMPYTSPTGVAPEPRVPPPEMGSGLDQFNPPAQLYDPYTGTYQPATGGQSSGATGFLGAFGGGGGSAGSAGYTSLDPAQLAYMNFLASPSQLPYIGSELGTGGFHVSSPPSLAGLRISGSGSGVAPPPSGAFGSPGSLDPPLVPIPTHLASPQTHSDPQGYGAAGGRGATGHLHGGSQLQDAPSWGGSSGGHGRGSTGTTGHHAPLGSSGTAGLGGGTGFTKYAPAYGHSLDPPGGGYPGGGSTSSPNTGPGGVLGMSPMGAMGSPQGQPYMAPSQFLTAMGGGGSAPAPVTPGPLMGMPLWYPASPGGPAGTVMAPPPTHLPPGAMPSPMHSPYATGGGFSAYDPMGAFMVPASPSRLNPMAPAWASPARGPVGYAHDPYNPYGHEGPRGSGSGGGNGGQYSSRGGYSGYTPGGGGNHSHRQGGNNSGWGPVKDSDTAAAAASAAATAAVAAATANHSSKKAVLQQQQSAGARATPGLTSEGSAGLASSGSAAAHAPEPLGTPPGGLPPTPQHMGRTPKRPTTVGASSSTGPPSLPTGYSGPYAQRTTPTQAVGSSAAGEPLARGPSSDSAAGATPPAVTSQGGGAGEVSGGRQSARAALDFSGAVSGGGNGGGVAARSSGPGGSVPGAAAGVRSTAPPTLTVPPPPGSSASAPVGDTRESPSLVSASDPLVSPSRFTRSRRPPAPAALSSGSLPMQAGGAVPPPYGQPGAQAQQQRMRGPPPPPAGAAGSVPAAVAAHSPMEAPATLHHVLASMGLGAGAGAPPSGAVGGSGTATPLISHIQQAAMHRASSLPMGLASAEPGAG